MVTFTDFGEDIDKSPSSRRAWVEILLQHCKQAAACRRPPRGGRG